MNSQNVVHKKFGIGCIVEVDEAVAKVKFENNVVKSFCIGDFDKYFEHDNVLIKKALFDRRMRRRAEELRIKETELKKERATEYEQWKKSVNTIPGIDGQIDYWEKIERDKRREPTHCWNCKTDLSYDDAYCKTCDGHICSKCGRCLCSTHWMR